MSSFCTAAPEVAKANRLRLKQLETKLLTQPEPMAVEPSAMEAYNWNASSRAGRGHAPCVSVVCGPMNRVRARVAGTSHLRSYCALRHTKPELATRPFGSSGMTKRAALKLLQDELDRFGFAARKVVQIISCKKHCCSQHCSSM